MVRVVLVSTPPPFRKSSLRIGWWAVDSCTIGDVGGRDGRANAVVLVSLLLDDRLHDVVDVVVNNFTDSLTLVNDAAVNGSLGEGVLRVASNSAHESGILVGVGVHLTHGGHRHNTAVDLLSKVLRVQNRLHVVLNVVLVDVVLTLADELLNLVAVVDVTGDRSKVLHVLVDVAGGDVHTRVDASGLGETSAVSRVNRLRLRNG